MDKPDTLRRLLLAAVPGLSDDPARLSMFIDQGRVMARAGSLSFRYAYTLNVVVQDYAGSVDALMVPIIAWIAENQPDLLQRPSPEPFRFGSELLDSNAADVSIYIDLSEDVVVELKPGGGFTHVHLAEPRDLDAFEDVCGVLLRQLKLNGDVVAESETPVGQ